MNRSSALPFVSLLASSRLAPADLGRGRRLLTLGLLVVLVPLAFWLAFAMRFDGSIPEHYFALFLATLPYLVAIRLGCLALFGLHRGWLRYAGVHDMAALFMAITTSTLLFWVTLLGIGYADDFPRSIVVLDWLVAFLLFGGGLFLIRLRHELRSGLLRLPDGKRTLVIGAGDAAACLLHDVRSGVIRGIHPVGLVDDAPAKRRLRIHGIPVLGSTRDLKALVARHRIRLLVIAIPSATRAQLQRIVERCVESGAEFKIVPSLGGLLQGRARMDQPREVRVEDLLGRSTVDLDLGSARTPIEGKTVLVTGGAGSIGSELARQIASLEPARLVLVDKAESALYFTQLEISQASPGLEVVPAIADITNRLQLERIFSLYRPAYLFHAAAYKHVPLMEINVEEAVRNNVAGTLYVAECAVRHGVGHFVLISTDKAVRPSSIMGATKRIAERIVLGLPRLKASETVFRAVRFGNVLGSDGSVIPLFTRQIAAGGPLTVTHPEVTRYFMTIPEASRLVLLAAVLRESAGRISMLEMGEPVRIIELAENLVRLSGLEPYRDIPIVFTGMRPGEKMHEELFTEVERTVPTTAEKIRIVQTDEADGAAIEAGLRQLMVALDSMDRPQLLSAIRALVPECVEPLRSLAPAAKGSVLVSHGPARASYGLRITAR